MIEKEINLENYPGKKIAFYYDNFLNTAESLIKKKIITPVFKVKSPDLEVYVCIFNKEGITLRVSHTGTAYYAKFMMYAPDSVSKPEEKMENIETMIWNEHQKLSGSDELK